MFRVINLLRVTTARTAGYIKWNHAPVISSITLQHRPKFLSTAVCQTPFLLQRGSSNLQSLSSALSKSSFLKPSSLQPSAAVQTQVRTVTKFSLKKGKRKTVKAAIKRFYRLDWGGWIRTRSGRHKHLWKKSSALQRRLRQHVFCNSTQSWLLDKMVTKYWRKRKYYVDDPYEPYHTREEFVITRKKPL